MDDPRWTRSSYTLSTLYAYRFISLLSKPYDKWPAYEMGLIDKKGNLIRNPSSTQDMDAYNKWHILIKNIKTILDNHPNNIVRIQASNFLQALAFFKDKVDKKDVEKYNQVVGKVESVLLDTLGLSTTLLVEQTVLEMKRDRGLPYDSTIDTVWGLYNIPSKLIPVETLYGENVYRLYNSLTREYDLVTEETIASGNTTTSVGLTGQSVLNTKPVKKKKSMLKRGLVQKGITS